jgi:hypothetical protein
MSEKNYDGYVDSNGDIVHPKETDKVDISFSYITENLPFTHIEINIPEKEVDELLEKIAQKDEVLYSMARLLRNTDGLYPSTWGTQAGQLLVKLRSLNESKYDVLVMRESTTEREEK